MLSNETLILKAKKIRLFFTDVDGTLTDGCTYYSASGEFMKKFSQIDGTGFFLLRQAGITAGIITGEVSEIVTRRAEKLRIKLCFMGIQNKLDFLQKFTIEQNVLLEEIAYIGDDLNDLLLLKNVGLSFACGNSHPLIKKEVDICCETNGGAGAFREAVENLLSLQNRDLYEIFNLVKS